MGTLLTRPSHRLGASSVKVYNYIHRHGRYPDDNTFFTGYKGPATRPHIDANRPSAPLLFSKTHPEVYAEVTESKKRWCIINTWRPLKTVQRDPLAVCDGTSVHPDDFLSVPQPQIGPGISTSLLKKSSGGAGHRWWWMSAQTPEDLLLFMQYDSEGELAVPHTAFDLPDPPDEARQSIEVRFFAVF